MMPREHKGRPSPWPARDEELRAHAATGASWDVIGDRMGIGKNAVIGRAKRLNLSKAASPRGRRKQIPARVAPVKAAAQPSAAAAPAVPDLVESSCNLPAAANLAPPAFSRERTPVGGRLANSVRAMPPGPIAPARTCWYPLWADGARPPSPPKFCGAQPAWIGCSYCQAHQMLCTGRGTAAERRADSDADKISDRAA